MREFLSSYSGQGLTVLMIGTVAVKLSFPFSSRAQSWLYGIPGGSPAQTSPNHGFPKNPYFGSQFFNSKFYWTNPNCWGYKNGGLKRTFYKKVSKKLR